MHHQLILNCVYPVVVLTSPVDLVTTLVSVVMWPLLVPTKNRSAGCKMCSWDNKRDISRI